MIKYQIHILLPSFETNTYLVWDDVSKEAILIDPAAPSESLKKEILSQKLKITKIINTHGHGDHIGGNDFFQQAFQCPIAIHQLDAKMLTNANLNLSTYMEGGFITSPAKILLNDSDEITLGKHTGKIIHTPGHTQGGIGIYFAPYLFSGDTLFQLDVGRTDLPGGDMQQLTKSIKEKIFVLPEETTVFPGHGPATTVKIEKERNPYLT